MLEEITPLIITYNEAPNIERTIERLTWANTIVIIDSYSTDETLKILQTYPQVKIFQKEFESFASQCNYGLAQIQSEWVLSLDADYILSDELINEIKALPKEPEVDSYIVKFKYCIFGHPLRGTLYPPRKVLYRTNKAVYAEDGHAHRVCIDGTYGKLDSYIYHDDRKPLDRWLKAQNNYMVIESKKILETPVSELSLSDRIRRQKILAPFLILFYCLIINKGILDGWPGWYYALQRTLAEILLAIHIIENEKLKPQNTQ
jgi:glycosyltransferase involved in cell wall biosynthesis